MKIAVDQILESGDSDGIVKVSLSDWNGFCFKFPRKQISSMKNYGEIVGNPAVYLLIGEQDMKSVCYVGETDDSVVRMAQHNSDDYWNEALIFIGSKDFPLNKARIKYLENLLYVEAKKASENTGRYEILNGNTPKQSPLSEGDEIKASYFFDHLKTICSVLGYKVFDSFIEENEISDNSENDLFVIKRGEADARMRITDEGFVVLKGSKTSSSFTNKTTECFKGTGKKMRDEGIIVNNTFVRDYLFKSCSGAAVIVLGHNSNGRTEWKNSKGKSIKELEEEKMK